MTGAVPALLELRRTLVVIASVSVHGFRRAAGSLEGIGALAAGGGKQGLKPCKTCILPAWLKPCPDTNPPLIG
jgi:hypothetical protein